VGEEGEGEGGGGGVEGEGREEDGGKVSRGASWTFSYRSGFMSSEGQRGGVKARGGRGGGYAWALSGALSGAQPGAQCWVQPGARAH